MALPSCPLVTCYVRPVPGMCDLAVTRRQRPHMRARLIYKDGASFVPGIGNRCFSGPQGTRRATRRSPLKTWSRSAGRHVSCRAGR
jgi:hypothetical protein